MAKIANSIIELIGQTPVVKLNHIVDENSADVYLKLEYMNPGSSVKDRIALAMVEEAEKNGQLKARRYNHRTYKWKYWNWLSVGSCSKRLQSNSCYA